MSVIFLCVGQSNMVGEHGPVAQFALTDCYMVGLDGFTRALTEPAFYNTNQATGGVNHIAADPAPGQSSLSAMAFRLRELGETRRLIFCPCALGGATATSWNTNLTPSPILYDNLFPASLHALEVAMAAPGALLGGILVNQGEAEASTSAVVANAWDTQWAAVFNAYLAYATSRGWTWAKTKRFWIDKLQNGSAYTWKTNVQARQDALAAARTDTVTFLEPDANPTDLHLWPADQNALGVLRANSWFAAS